MKNIVVWAQEVVFIHVLLGYLDIDVGWYLNMIMNKPTQQHGQLIHTIEHTHHEKYEAHEPNLVELFLICLPQFPVTQQSIDIHNDHLP